MQRFPFDKEWIWKILEVQWFPSWVFFISEWVLCVVAGLLDFEEEHRPFIQLKLHEVHLHCGFSNSTRTLLQNYKALLSWWLRLIIEMDLLPVDSLGFLWWPLYFNKVDHPFLTLLPCACMCLVYFHIYAFILLVDSNPCNIFKRNHKDWWKALLLA